MSAPPAAIVVTWCPECERTDRFSPLRMPPHRHFAHGRLCVGKPMRVWYKPVRQQPLRDDEPDEALSSGRPS